MLITGLTDSQLTTAKNIADSKYGGNIMMELTRLSNTRYRVKLRAVSSKVNGARRSWSGRRSIALCWHAFRDFMVECFNINPNARIQTSMETYRGVDDFRDKYISTARTNIGSQAQPAFMPYLCECQQSLAAKF